MRALVITSLSCYGALEIVFVLLGRPYGVTGGLIKCSWCFFFISFASFSPPSLDRSPWNFATWSETGGLDKLSPKIRGALLPKKWGPKTCKISGGFLPLLTLIANISGTDHHVESLKIPLSTTSHSTLGQKNWWTLVHKQQSESGSYWPTQVDIFQETTFRPLVGATPSNF